jgi:hypothetical protein
MVDNFYEHQGDDVNWLFSWRRPLFQWENTLVTQLRELLVEVVLTMEEDFWCWNPDPEESFSVNSCYKLLVQELSTESELEEETLTVFNQIWESPAPSKVIAFSWQLLYDRITTRSNLDARGMIRPEDPKECVGCVGVVESSTHLFVHCPSAISVWYGIFRWLGLVIIAPPSLSVLFEVFRGAARNKKLRQGFLLIWHVTIWAIWKARNSSIFAGGAVVINEIVDEIKVLSWKWCLARLKVRPSLFYEWSWDPGDCLQR